MAKKSKMKRVDPVGWPGVYMYEGDRKIRGKPDSCFYIAYKIDGKKKWEKVGFKSEGYTPAVAAEIRAARVKTARHGDDVKTAKEIRAEKSKTNRPLNQIAIEYFKNRGGSEFASKIDQGRYDKHVKPVIGLKSIKNLCPLDMKRIEKQMEDMAPASIWGALELVRRIVNFGARSGLCQKLNFIITMPKRDNEVVEYLQPEEVARLLDVLEMWPNRDAARMLKIAMFTGMRRGEIFKLEKRDLDFRQEIITLRSPKGGKTVSIPMNQAAKDVFRKQIASNKERFPDSLFIFPGSSGQKRTACSAAKRIKTEAGLPDTFRMFHGLRHHFAVTLANSGQVSLDMIGELLTHKSNDMTRRYAQFLPDTKKKASDTALALFEIQQRAGNEFTKLPVGQIAKKT